MKKIFIIIFILAIAPHCPLLAQKINPMPVRRIVYEIHPDDWYHQQAKLWKKETEKRPSDPKAWLNYYNAVRYEKFEDNCDDCNKQEMLTKIVNQMKKNVPDSWQYNYLAYHNSGNNPQKISYLEKAYQIAPEQPEIYYDFISYYLISGDEKKANDFFKKLYRSKDIAPQLLNYNYNMLVSVEKGGIVFTNGDNDTFPILMLQKAKGIRTDVTVLNIHLCFTANYLKTQLKKIGIRIDSKKFIQKSKTTDEKGRTKLSTKKFLKLIIDEIAQQKPDVPIYISATVYPQYLEEIMENLYIVGLVYRYSKDKIDNIAFIKKNIEKKYRLDYLENDWYHEHDPIQTIMAQMNNNYLPAIFLLAEHYKNSGEREKIAQLKNLVFNIGRAAGREEKIQNYFQKIIKE